MTTSNKSNSICKRLTIKRNPQPKFVASHLPPLSHKFKNKSKSLPNKTMDYEAIRYDTAAAADGGLDG